MQLAINQTKKNKLAREITLKYFLFAFSLLTLTETIQDPKPYLQEENETKT